MYHIEDATTGNVARRPLRAYRAAAPFLYEPSTLCRIPGESYLAVLDAFHDRTDDFRFTICRNEGGASFMATAHGKLTGRPGLCFVTRGPGATNASIGVHTAFQDSTPMLLFVGQVGTDMRGREAFQEIDYRRFYGDLTKWVVEIDDCERIPELLSRAWATAVSGRPGPVVVALPENMLRATTSVEPCRLRLVHLRTRYSPQSRFFQRQKGRLLLLVAVAGQLKAAKHWIPFAYAPACPWLLHSVIRIYAITTIRVTSVMRV